jgi:hypothetical protein
MHGVHLARRDEVMEAEKGGDGQEALDARRSLAHCEAGLQAAHPGYELPADQQYRQHEAALDSVPHPSDAAAARAESGTGEDGRRRLGVEPGERSSFLDGRAREAHESHRTHPNPL